MPKLIINQEPGTTYTNSGTKVLYQFVANLSNTCGLCIQYHHAISSYWPIPLHRSCRCQQRPVPPGKDSLPFVDFRDVIGKLDPRQQAVVVGKSNLVLIDRGIVEWKDVVTPTRVRDFREVVSLKKLDVKQMTKAGVPAYQARQAYATVHTPAHVLADQQRKRLVDHLASKGVAKPEIEAAFGEKIAARVKIGEGPSGPQPMPGVKPSGPLSPIVAKHLGINPNGPTFAPPSKPGKPRKAKATPIAEPVPTRPTPEPTAPQPRPLPDIAAKLAAYTEGDRKVRLMATAGDHVERAREELATRRAEVDTLMARERSATPGERAGIAAELAASRTLLRAAMDREQSAQRKARVNAMAVMKAGTGVEFNDPYNTKEGLPGDARNAAEAAVSYVGIVMEKGNVPWKVPVAWAGLTKKEGRRAYYDQGFVHLYEYSRSATAVHELGHLLEDKVPGWNAAVQGFLKHRCGDEAVVKLSTIDPEYAPDELGRKDKFGDAFGENMAYYVGKHYGPDASEITAMGLEKLFEDPAGFARKDPEYVKFLLGLLDGGLR